VDDQSDIPSFPAMSFGHQSLMGNHGVCAAADDPSDGLFHVSQARDRSHGNSVIHWNHHCFSGVSIDDPFYTDTLS
jgi:hypothetical protein